MKPHWYKKGGLWWVKQPDSDWHIAHKFIGDSTFVAIMKIRPELWTQHVLYAF